MANNLEKENLENNTGTENSVPLSVEEAQKIVNEMQYQESNNENVKIVKTDEGAKDGQTKCPACGATDITLNINNGISLFI